MRKYERIGASYTDDLGRRLEALEPPHVSQAFVADYGEAEAYHTPSRQYRPSPNPSTHDRLALRLLYLPETRVKNERYIKKISAPPHFVYPVPVYPGLPSRDT